MIIVVLTIDASESLQEGTHNWTGDLLHLYFLHYKKRIDISNDEHYHVSTRLGPDRNFAAKHCLNREAAEY